MWHALLRANTKWEAGALQAHDYREAVMARARAEVASHARHSLRELRRQAASARKAYEETLATGMGKQLGKMSERRALYPARYNAIFSRAWKGEHAGEGERRSSRRRVARSAATTARSTACVLQEVDSADLFSS